MNKVLVDTNILVYSIDEDSQFYNQSRELILNPDIELFTTSKNISEFLSVVTRIPNNSISIEEALKSVDAFTSMIKLLYPNEESFLEFEELLLKYKPTGIKIHDFEIVSIAIVNDINTIATLNKKDFEIIKEINTYKNN